MVPWRVQLKSQDVVTAATVAIGVPEFGVETSAEIDAQLFVVLSALTEGEASTLAQAARKVEPVHSGTSTKSLEGDSVADASQIA